MPHGSLAATLYSVAVKRAQYLVVYGGNCSCYRLFSLYCTLRHYTVVVHVGTKGHIYTMLYQLNDRFLTLCTQ